MSSLRRANAHHRLYHAQHPGTLAAPAAQGHPPGFADVSIAALAQQAGLVLLTRNLKHFAPLGVNCLDPLVDLPGTP